MSDRTQEPGAEWQQASRKPPRDAMGQDRETAPLTSPFLAGAEADPGGDGPSRSTPYPGLRPFEADEAHLFFGRDEQSDELLRRLRRNRFLAVVGTSGSGKSSLVRAGVLPSLYGGFMVEAGSVWRVATLRPGADPFRNLAAALNASEVFGSSDDGEDPFPASLFTEATLRRGPLGVVEATRHGRLARDENLLVLVDQFEEIFRFALAAAGDREDHSAAFVKLMLEAVRQQELPIYVILTMRSDFLGDCARFCGLPEAINDGQYLIPRLTREQLREAIVGPAAVGGAEMAPRLVQRLLGEVGDDPDQLPVLQHALMRTWDIWAADGGDRGPVDLPHYRATGGMAEALSRHADEAWQELPDEHHREIARKLFQRLTEKGEGHREVRRPTRLGEVCEVAEASEDAVVRVVEAFRCPGRSFLMPPAGVALTSDSTLDISHESLMRVWIRLKGWLEDEAESASRYRRLAQSATLHAAGIAGLMTDPELSVTLDWRQKSQVNTAWAKRYDPTFERADAFLEESRRERGAALLAEKRRRRQKLRRTRAFAGILGLAFLTAVGFGIYAQRARNSAEKQARIARNATSAQLANTALLHSTERLGLNSLLAIQAGKTADTPEARNSLLSIVQANPRLQTYLHHQDRVWSVAFSPDGKILASASDAVRLWDVESRRPLGEPLSGHTGSVASVAFSPDGKILASASRDGIRLWEVPGWQPLGEPLVRHGDRVRSVAFSPDGKILASASEDWTIQLWEVARRRPLGETLAGHTGSVARVVFSPDGSILASAGDDRTIRLWDEAGRPLGEPLRGHEEDVANVAFSPDGKILASVGCEKTAENRCTEGAIRLWDLAAQRPLDEPLTGHTDRVASVAFSPDGAILASASYDGSVRLWDMAARQALGEPLVGHTHFVLSVAFSPDGTIIASGSEDRSVLLWDRSGRQPLGETLGEHRGAVMSAAFSPDGTILASASYDRSLRLWEVADRQPLGEPLTAGGAAVLSVAFSPSGTMLASGDLEGNLQLWDVVGQRPLGEPLSRHESGVLALAFHPGGTLLASATADQTVQLWDMASLRPLGQPLIRYDGMKFPRVSIAFSPDGRVLAVGGCARIGDNGACIQIGVRLWDLVGQRWLGEPLSGLSVAFSPDGKILSSGGHDGKVQLWDVASTQPLGEPLTGHQGEVSSLAFSPDGSILASAGRGDGTVRLWDVSGQRPLGKPLSHISEVFSVAFNHDGTLLASGSKDRSIRLWNMTSDFWMEQACRRANRNLSLVEWQQYMGRDAPYQRTCSDLPPGTGVFGG